MVHPVVPLLFLNKFSKSGLNKFVTKVL